MDAITIFLLCALLGGIPFRNLVSGAVPALRPWKELLLACLVTWSCVAQVMTRRFTWRSVVAGGPVAFFLLIVVARGTIGVLSGEDPYLATYGAYNLCYWALLAGVAYGLSLTPSHVDRLVAILASVIAFVGFVAVTDWVFEWAAPLHPFESLNRTQYIGSGYRAYLGADNPMSLGIYLGVGVLMSAYLSGRRSRHGRIVGILRLMASFAGLIVTFSRGPLVATMGGMLILLFLLKRGLTKRAVRRAPLTVATLLACVGGGIAVIGQLPDESLVAYAQSVTNWSSEPTNLTRVAGWLSGIARFRERPIQGYGLGEASTRTQAYRAARGDAYFQPESAILALGVEGGIVLLGAFALLMVRLLWRLLPVLTSAEATTRRGLVTLFYSAVAAILVEMAINPLLDFRSATVITWIVIGFTARLGDFRASDDDAPSRSTTQIAPRDPPFAVALALP